MEIEGIKKKLKSYTVESIALSDHTLIRCFQRGITKENILDNILKPEKLIDIIEEESKYRGERKFKLVFDLSRNKSFIVVVSINKKLTVITAVIRYRKWVRPIGIR